MKQRNYKKRILFISSNDASDIRINKELKTLSSLFKITYVGVGFYSNRNFGKQYCDEFYLIEGKRNTLLTFFKHIALVLRIVLTRRIASVHIINEQLMIFFYPILFFKHVVLDVFDSIFLLWSKSGNSLLLLKWFVYLPVNKILVTDLNRKKLMPSFLSKKILILPNYPLQYEFVNKMEVQSDTITIFYSGCMMINRGTEMLYKLLKQSEKIKVIMVGWCFDEETESLINLPGVDFRGVVTQDKSLEIADQECDYIMCMYAPINENNINASPNKIYDSIITKVPVIINGEVLISEFVRQNKIGIILDSFYETNVSELVERLFAERNTFKFSEQLTAEYTWERVEHILIKSHLE